ncbi:MULTISPECIES: hypothetical protein [unclassified Thiomonas]|uniref:hypothetical protein n=1 Tax=unclassified Thiomonas TaxID=2625466 RepID=UPI0012A97B8F|nr:MULTISPECIES: hypothetical protein [unclassified Thiomonas]VDY06919.1 protein of unknown function [Thiomonas sp. Bio17B3]VDY09785.1 protein of unknown function [Thiomonas sp. Sup16B3]VDY11020.1 protein of unknown function [Thiomonas sp. Sup16B3]VDY11434.1 protein of unknown function [Thiomonas sp. Bio17B3]
MPEKQATAPAPISPTQAMEQWLDGDHSSGPVKAFIAAHDRATRQPAAAPVWTPTSVVSWSRSRGSASGSKGWGGELSSTSIEQRSFAAKQKPFVADRFLTGFDRHATTIDH